MTLFRIEDSQGKSLEDANDIVNEAVRIFQEQFFKDSVNFNFDMLENVLVLLNAEDRMEMEKWLDKEEVRRVIFDLNKDSASGLGDFSGEFYQTW